jgi:dihydroxy-acid dehydratase
MAMGTEGMKYSLVSREVIADCSRDLRRRPVDGRRPRRRRLRQEHAGRDDRGILRANVPAIYVYGGTDPARRYQGQDLNIVSVFEAVGQFTAGKMSEKDFGEIERRAHPRQRLVRRHVHRQHDELGVRGARQ